MMPDATRLFLETAARVLMRCWILGFALLLVWLGAVLALGDLIHRAHGGLFGLSPHDLDVVMYSGMGLLKLSVLTLFFIPWLAIRLELKKNDD